MALTNDEEKTKTKELPLDRDRTGRRSKKKLAGAGRRQKAEKMKPEAATAGHDEKDESPSAWHMQKQRPSKKTNDDAGSRETGNCKGEVAEENQAEADVFEVSVEKTTVDPNVEFSQQTYKEEKETKSIDISTELPAVPEPKHASIHDLTLAKDEINMLKTKLQKESKRTTANKEDKTEAVELTRTMT